MTEKRCAATTAAGALCKARPMRGGDTCKAHSGDRDVGRPSKLTEDVRHKITLLIRNGNYIEAACTASDVAVSTFYAWRERGEADLEAGRSTMFSEFTEAVTRAHGESEAILVQKAQAAADKDGRVALEILARRFPERWSQRAELRHSGGLGLTHSPDGHDREPIVTQDEGFWADVAQALRQVGVIDETPNGVDDPPDDGRQNGHGGRP